MNNHIVSTLTKELDLMSPLIRWSGVHNKHMLKCSAAYHSTTCKLCKQRNYKAGLVQKNVHFEDIKLLHKQSTCHNQANKSRIHILHQLILYSQAIWNLKLPAGWAGATKLKTNRLL